jgi:hypothetical protein
MTLRRHPRAVLIGDPVSKSDGCSIRDFEDDVTAAAIHISLRRHPRGVLIGDPVSKSDRSGQYASCIV